MIEWTRRKDTLKPTEWNMPVVKVVLGQRLKGQIFEVTKITSNPGPALFFIFEFYFTYFFI